MFNRFSIPAVLFCLFSLYSPAALNVTYTIDTQTGRAPISPYIYGYNFDHVTSENLTVRRMGGNRTTGYNWENNFSNAGSDWYHHSDRYMSNYLPWSQQLTPGKVYTDFHNDSLAAGQASVLTLQMAGYVAADDAGTVSEADTAPSARWKQVVFKKPTPFAATPNTTDNTVYMDEFVNHLATTFGAADSPTGVRFYALDNEPALWSHTHARIHPGQPTCTELIDRSVALAAAVKDVDPAAQITGPALYGFAAFLDFQGAPDWSSVRGSYNWFIDYYLAQMRVASNTQGRRLLDVLDVHWYPEARDDNDVRITDFAATDTNYTARMQAPRSLWDPSYTENSWIGQWFSGYLPLLPELRASIDARYPGTKLAFTEYNYGGHNHVSGGIAQADVLGIFGRYGVHLATYWGSNGAYTNAAFRLYRNYDGALSTCGDTAVTAAPSDTVNSSLYASLTDGNENRLHLIVLNKHLTQPINANFSIAAAVPYTSARVWAFDAVNTAITERAPVSSITNNSFTYAIPPLTACHIVLTSDRPAADLTADCLVNLDDLAELALQWLTPGACPAVKCADLNHDGFVDNEDLALMTQQWQTAAPCN